MRHGFLMAMWRLHMPNHQIASKSLEAAQTSAAFLGECSSFPKGNALTANPLGQWVSQFKWGVHSNMSLVFFSATRLPFGKETFNYWCVHSNRSLGFRRPGCQFDFATHWACGLCARHSANCTDMRQTQSALSENSPSGQTKGWLMFLKAVETPGLKSTLE